jgi:hypothetical protein
MMSAHLPVQSTANACSAYKDVGAGPGADNPLADRKF